MKNLGRLLEKFSGRSLKGFSGKTKRGAVSMYVVIFATVLFGVVTVSFIRVMLSEVSQSGDDDLSQSAYDAAMAGVEDAKIAVNEYYQCLGKNSADYCKAFNVITENPDDPKCDRDYLLGKVLHKREDFEEIPIVATSTNINNDTDVTDQAYTCVIISDVTPDYRGTLTADTRTKVIPLNVTRDGVSTASDFGSVVFVDFSWYSELNRGALKSSNYRVSSGGTFGNLQDATIPPTVQLRLIKVTGDLDLEKLRNSNNKDLNVIDSTMVLLPASAENDTLTQVDSADIIKFGQIENKDEPVKVFCGDGEFACTVRLEVAGLSLNNGDNVFLVASMPYGDAMSDFAVTLRQQDGTAVKFKGVQISVDSTGRTNQLFRRVETRLDPADLFFPYPQYEIELSGGGDSSLTKNFWVTANCWYSQPGSGGLCANNGDL